jgi:hypothetical protein
MRRFIVSGPVTDTGWGNAGGDPLEPGCPLRSPDGV